VSAERWSAAELAARTTSTRDRYVDLLRAGSIIAVVFGHWFIGVIHWNHGVIRTTSAIGVTSGLWIATWFLQVMPVFFFVGGFSNSWRTRRTVAGERRSARSFATASSD
jgi:fucose 4-O-acetylase-like acetyltransferase